MEKITAELQEIVTSFSIIIKDMQSLEFNAKPDPAKWSKKEVLGHLIDSAHNNLRRFVVGQYEQQPNIVYDQDLSYVEEESAKNRRKAAVHDE